MDLYTPLHKLKADGLFGVGFEKIDNRIRKYYKLTEHGENENLNKLNELDEFIKNMQVLVNIKLT